MTEGKRILVNGFGRVGRALFRALEARDAANVVAINDTLPVEQLAYLLKYDTVMGRFAGDVGVDGDKLTVNDRTVAVSRQDKLTPGECDGIDVVVNSSGRNNSRGNLEDILAGGAKRVVVSKPLPSGVGDRTVLFGLNQHELTDDDRIISAGSCTAHCYTPILKVIHDRWPVVRGYMLTVHAYTSGQNIVDGGHEGDPRRGRAGAQNIVPTTTESLVAFEQVMPELAGRITGMAQRVPVVNGSNVELVLELEGRVTVEELNGYVRGQAADKFAGVIEYTNDPIVSGDIVGNPHSAVFDSRLTHTQPGDETTMARIIAWYDNEWGYSNRLADLLCSF